MIIISTDRLHISPDRLRTSDLDDYMGTWLHVSTTKCHLQNTKCKSPTGVILVTWNVSFSHGFQ